MKTIRELLESGDIKLDTKVLGTLPTNEDGDIWGWGAKGWAFDKQYGKVLSIGWKLTPDWHEVEFSDSYSSRESAESAPKEE